MTMAPRVRRWLAEGAAGEWRGRPWGSDLEREERQWWLDDGDGGGDGDSLRFYVAITVPQMPLSKINGMVILISERRTKERHLIFGSCWRDCSA